MGELRRYRVLYGDLSAAFSCEAAFSMVTGLESVHNLDVTARILLNGGNNFFAACDFKELRVAKRAHSTTST
jgi:hypothetical protein